MDTRDPEADRQAAVTPAELFVDRTLKRDLLAGWQLGIVELVEAELAPAVVRVPEHRARRYHLGRIRQVVERGARRPHDLYREAVDLLEQLCGLATQRDLGLGDDHGVS